MKFTILGSSGFIGSALVSYLKEMNIDFETPKIEDCKGGHVIYCIGVTSDFKTRPFDTTTAHVCLLKKVLNNFDSFIYLSSTRIYDDYGQEDSVIKVYPKNIDYLYNISKVMGESLCFTTKAKVVRLSNVYGYGSNNFLSSIIKDAIKGEINLKTTLNSCRNYVSIKDVVSLLVKISLSSKHRLYNIASEENTTNGAVVSKLRQLTNCKVREGTNEVYHPSINIDRIRNEFDFKPSNVINDLTELVNQYRERRAK